MSNIGLMEGAFFVGRKEIMDWVNSTLNLNLQKVEDTASGAVACQLLDIMYPGQVPMAKVNWAAKQSFEFVANYKILQTCFEKLHIERHIDVDRLIAGRYMDNLEFMQWFKRFFEMSVSDIGDYDAAAQRSKGKGGSAFGGASGAAKRPSITKPSSAPSAIAKPATKAAPAAAPAPKEKTAAAPAAAKHAPAAAKTEAPANNHEVTNLKLALEDSHRAYSDLRTEMDGLEKERDFYFEKLRDVEVLLQELEDKGQGTELSASILKILYATAEGFEQVAEPEAAAEAAPAAAPEDTY